jgi:hypothetical protein
VAQTKDILRDLIDTMPDDCTIEDVVYRLYVIDAARRGRADLDAGRTVPQADVARELGVRWGRARAK